MLRADILDEIVLQLSNSNLIQEPFVTGQRIHFKLDGYTYRLNIGKQAEGSSYERQKEKNARIYQAKSELRSNHEEEYQRRYKFYKQTLPAHRAASLAYRDLTFSHPKEWEKIRRSWLEGAYAPGSTPTYEKERYAAFVILRKRHEDEYVALRLFSKARFPSIPSGRHSTYARNELISKYKEEFDSIRKGKL